MAGSGSVVTSAPAGAMDMQSPGAPAPIPHPRRWRTLALLCTAYFMIILDAQIVILALPSIQRALGFEVGGAQWVMSAYLVAFGGLLLLGGRAADLLGRRRMFIMGSALFLVASLLCGLAWSPQTLVGARVGQGVSAAIMTPTGLSILIATFPEGPERTRALGVWSGVGAVGATAALLIGGPLAELLGWRSIFLLNVPIAGALLALSPRLLPESHAPTTARTHSYDGWGAITITLALVVLITHVVEAPKRGWFQPRTIGALAGAVLLSVTFAAIEARSPAPLVPLRLFRSAGVIGGNLSTLFLGMAAFGTSLAVSLYAQQVLGLSALAFGFGVRPASSARLSVRASSRSHQGVLRDELLAWWDRLRLDRDVGAADRLLDAPAHGAGTSTRPHGPFLSCTRFPVQADRGRGD